MRLRRIRAGGLSLPLVDRNGSTATGLVIRRIPETTTRSAIVETRIGQGIFRTAVLQQWGGACCVTGVTTPDALRAGHIKPWAESSHAERLDPANGLPLVATLDALFDRGLITFKPDGNLRISKRCLKHPKGTDWASPA